jgi:hypothetical protein
LQRELHNAVLRDVTHAGDDERSCAFVFDAAAGERRLHVELFGARGLWALCDQGGVCLTMSRAVETAVRTLHRGDVYVPPPPSPGGGDRKVGEPRFAPPVLDAIDAHFTALDLEKEQAQSETTLRLAAQRARASRPNRRCVEQIRARVPPSATCTKTLRASGSVGCSTSSTSSCSSVPISATASSTVAERSAESSATAWPSSRAVSPRAAGPAGAGMGRAYFLSSSTGS